MLKNSSSHPTVHPVWIASIVLVLIVGCCLLFVSRSRQTPPSHLPSSESPGTNSFLPLQEPPPVQRPATAQERLAQMPIATTASAAYGNLPLSFEINDVEANPQVKFESRGP